METYSVIVAFHASIVSISIGIYKNTFQCIPIYVYIYMLISNGIKRLTTQDLTLHWCMQLHISP